MQFKKGDWVYAIQDLTAKMLDPLGVEEGVYAASDIFIYAGTRGRIAEIDPEEQILDVHFHTINEVLTWNWFIDPDRGWVNLEEIDE